MIIDYPFVSALAIGADRVIPTEGDAQTFVPPTLQPVITPFSAHGVSSASTDRATTSKLLELNVTSLNGIARTDDLIVLPKGLYLLQVNLAGRANFTTVVLADTLLVQITYLGFTTHLAGLMLNTGTGTLSFSSELLLLADATLSVFTSATNAIATNSISWNIGVNVIRRI